MSHRPRPDPADAEGDGAAAEAASARRSAGSGGGPAPARAHAPEPAPAPAHAQRIPHVRNLHWENEVDVKRLLESKANAKSVLETAMNGPERTFDFGSERAKGHKGKGNVGAQQKLPDWAVFDIPQGAALRVRGYGATHVAHAIRRQDVPEWRVAIIPRRVHRGAAVATIAESTRIPEPHCYKRPSGSEKSGADFQLTEAEACELRATVPLRRPRPPAWWAAAGPPPPALPPPSRPLPHPAWAAPAHLALPRVQAVLVPSLSEVASAARAALRASSPGPPPPPPPPEGHVGPFPPIPRNPSAPPPAAALALEPTARGEGRASAAQIARAVVEESEEDVEE
eukprot:gene19284-biopygen1900